MITTTEPRREASAPSHTQERSLVERLRQATAVRCRKVTCLVLAALLITACTNSRLIISPLYNQLDDRIRSEYLELADFSDAQTTAFEQAVGTYHVWHRQSELPRYAVLMQEIADNIAAPGQTTVSDVQGWMDSVETYTQAARECHPVNYLFDMLQTLSDRQLDTMQARLQQEREERLERYSSRTPEERMDKRLQNVEKWAGRINLELTDIQRTALQDTLSRQISMHQQYYELNGAWREQFFTLVRDRQAPDFQARLSQHMSRMWTLVESSHPEAWQANRRLWRDSLENFAHSLTDEQRRTVSNWLNGMSDTLFSIAADEPSFEVSNDPAVGCLVDSSS